MRDRSRVGAAKGEPTLSGWGRQAAPGREVCGEDLAAVADGVALSRGLGRSYGDASLPPASRPLALNTTRADRILALDEGTGLLRAEAGLSLKEMNRLLLPRGWFTPVTPGTQYVTLGGMVAADVHGKGQHVMGDFGDHVTRLQMRVADGRVLWCSPDEHRDLFLGTIGGMGLTGHMLQVEVQLRRVPSPWIFQESRRIGDIDEFQEELGAAAQRWPYTVGWFDCLARGARLGRGILMCGRWAEAGEAPRRWPRAHPSPVVPFDFPSGTLNRFTIGAFNQAFYWKHLQKRREGIVDYESFFYPLDAIREWNRIYGRRGMTQYQCVLPREAGRGSARRVLEVLTRAGGVSFLSVIKDFGRDGRGVLSFPRPGITLNLDLPVRDDTRALVDALNEQVLADGGRIYLAKDAFTRAEHFRAMEGPRLEAFQRLRDTWDPQRRLQSALSLRLLGD
jgi:decaprenylphospho-beta-D-ribofuranose 2-oxidase